jgi:hypothetical protein
MMRLPCAVHMLGFVVLCTSTLAPRLAGQGGGSPPAPPATPATPAAQASDTTKAAPAGLKLSGFGEASYVYSNNAESGAIVGRLYDRYSQAFSLNALELIADRPYATNKIDAGVHANVIIGQNAAVIQSTGFSVGPNIDMSQLFVTLNLPTANGNGVQFRFGKMVTLMGLEVIETNQNPNWSLGNQFIYVENFTSTGLELDYKPSGKMSIALRVDNGWDRVVDTAGHLDFMGSLAFTPSGNTSITFVPFYGPQQEDTNAARYGLDVLFNQKVGKASFWFQGDYGKEKANANLPDPTRDAEWWAVGGWLAVDVSPTLNLAGRADYFDDKQGARTFTTYALPIVSEHKLWSLTGTFNIKAWPNTLIRPEIRYDHSSFTVFNGHGDQVSAALSATYSF